MKNFFGTYLLLSFLFHGTFAQVQSKKIPTIWNPFISIDYVNAISKDVRDYYNQIVGSYQSAGILIPTQTEFGKTVGINAGVYFTRLESIWWGFSIAYLYSPAYSSYEDYSGTLKINGRMTSFDILCHLKVVLMKVNDIQFNSEISPGLNYSESTITQEINYFTYPENNLNKHWSEYAWGPILKATLGSSIPIGEFILSINGGYRFSLNNVPQDRIIHSTKIVASSGWNIGISGYILSVSFGKIL